MPRTLPQALGFTFGFWLALTLLVPVTAPWAFALDPEISRMEGRLAGDVNAFRRERRLMEFTRDPKLDAVARAHSQDMVNRRYLSHQNPEGENWVVRIQKAGIQGFAMAGENVGQTNKANPNHEILSGWIHSPEHLQNLVARAYNTTGIGIAKAPDGTFVYTQLYVTFPRD